MRLVFSAELPNIEPVRAVENRALVPESMPSAKIAGTQKPGAKESAQTDRVSRQSLIRLVPPVLILLIASLAVLVPSYTQAQAVRLVQGVVRNTDEQPLPNAVVYLQDQKSLEVRTYIVQTDGHYRFGQMSPDVDYQLWAEAKGHKSKTRSISSFDSKKEFNFDLKIDTSK